MGLVKPRIANGVAPYSITLTTLVGLTSLYVASGLNEDELGSVPDSVIPDIEQNGYRMTITDVNGKTNTISMDGVTFQLSQKVWHGTTVDNGDINIHKEWIDKCVVNGWNWIGVTFADDNNQIKNDAQLAIMETGTPYDHTTAGETFLVPFSETVRKSFLTNTTNPKLRVSLVVKISLCRMHTRLNNSGDTTVFYGITDAAMRPDQTTPINNGGGVVPREIMPSITAPAVLTSSARISGAFFRYYKKYIDNGTIAVVGEAINRSAEAEMDGIYTDANGTGEGFSNGDFHTSSVALFKSLFPEHNSVDNNTLYNSTVNTTLGKHWNYSWMYALKNLETAMINAAAPHTTRTKFWGMFAGSYVDPASAGRRTWNTWERAKNPKMFSIKAHDDPYASDTNMIKFLINTLTSIARYMGGICFWEISPPGNNWADPDQKAAVKQAMLLTMTQGVGISALIQSGGDNPIQQVFIETGLLGQTTKPHKDEFTGSHQLVRLVFNLSAIYSAFGTSTMKTAMFNAMSTAGVNMIDILVNDDINPNGTALP